MKQARVNTSLRLVMPSSSFSGALKKSKNKNDATATKKDHSKLWKILGLTFIYLFLAVMAVIVLFPFYYMIAASFMTQSAIESSAIVPNIASVFENIAYNYSNTFQRLHFLEHLGTTLLVTISTTILQLLTTILAAYAFAQMKFRGKEVLFLFFLATMMVPGELLAVANYTTLSNMDLIGKNQSYFQAVLAMILPLIASSFYIYLLRQNFLQCPQELYLAAKVDGKSDWQYLWNVMVPICRPTLVTIILLSFISSWNSYVWPSRAVYNPSYQVISVIIRTGSLTVKDALGNYVTQYAWQMTASVLTVVPLLILFIVFRKNIMSGTGRGGIKG